MAFNELTAELQKIILVEDIGVFHQAKKILQLLEPQEYQTAVELIAYLLVNFHRDSDKPDIDFFGGKEETKKVFDTVYSIFFLFIGLAYTVKPEPKELAEKL